MVLKINDWEFDIDERKTQEHSSFIFQEHCTCGYCENYYRVVPRCCPNLESFLSRFGCTTEGPSEMYPIEPTLYLCGYRVYGKILRAGMEPIMVDGVPVSPEIREDQTFMLEIGEMMLPWVLPEDPNEVVSPANEPEFLEKMYRKLLSRHTGYLLLS